MMAQRWQMIDGLATGPTIVRPHPGTAPNVRLPEQKPGFPDRRGNHRPEHRRAGVGYRHRLAKTRLSGDGAVTDNG